MDRQTQLRIYRAQVENVRELVKAWTHLNRTINRELIDDNVVSARLHTRLLVLVFSAWSEVNFSKLIHTPHGFKVTEIQQIKIEANINQVRGWKKCLELGLRNVGDPSKSNYLPNIRRQVERIIDDYVADPSVMRNRIAHGQWDTALNTRSTAINPVLTKRIRNLDVVTLHIWREAHKCLSNIVELLIESPKRAFHRDYWEEYENLREHLRRTENWCLADKVERLKTKEAWYSNSLPTEGS